MKKFIEEIDVNDWEVETDTGFADINKIYKTIEFEIWEIKTENFELKCADTHIVFDENMNQVFVKDLKINDKIQTKNGIEKIIYINNTLQKDNMYDIELNDNNHRYWSNGILSHNTTSVGLFVLWYTIFQKNKFVGIVANNADQAKDILKNVKDMYLELPYWLKPGVKSEWNKHSVEFENGSRIKTAATSSSSFRGKPLNLLICLSGKNKIKIKDKITNQILYLTIEELKNKLKEEENGKYLD